jgi:hypothetical protein
MIALLRGICSGSASTGLPVVTSHTRTFRSDDVEITRVPSGLNCTVEADPSWLLLVAQPQSNVADNVIGRRICAFISIFKITSIVSSLAVPSGLGATWQPLPPRATA